MIVLADTIKIKGNVFATLFKDHGLRIKSLPQISPSKCRTTEKELLNRTIWKI